MQKVSLVYDGPVADVYVDGKPGLAELEAAFCDAFGVPSPAVFDGGDAARSFVDFIDKYSVAECWLLERKTFATKLNIYLYQKEDVTSKLSRLSNILGMPVVVDVGRDIRDDNAFLFTPEGDILSGSLEPTPGISLNAQEDVRFSPAAAA
ncbi:hypothetical protein [Rhizobium sp. M1]|uniref:hypothetical protein n=1 Tax=Rhizobium sp. M1 TaxID=2035453 RepID=UPI000BEA75B2|nr:hypothetical protein [Rhizobium sp. M1]PDT11910.1 hypothetical protein CO655_06610 [Rhizobium sp. M1]